MCTTLQLGNITAHVFSEALVQMYVYGFIIMLLNVFFSSHA